MSTDHTLVEATIAALETAPNARIKRFDARLRGNEKAIRRVTMVTHIHDWIMNTTAKHQDLHAAVRAHFGVFIKGEPLDDLYFMKRVSRVQDDGTDDFSDEAWSVRPNFKPLHRFFGGFVLPDWVFVTNYRPRKYLTTDALWHAEIDKSIRVWDAIIPTIQRVTCSKLADCITSNAEHLDDRWDEA